MRYFIVKLRVLQQFERLDLFCGQFPGFVKQTAYSEHFSGRW